ncbi:MAG: hypothetical protein AMJ90_06860 [candidate division Zixibacteria bacterium SM23_73_2]|nr:MAG: hypothetical protein AMJ90_06860 [candidate division Zixibacteria bacterium SM23_73_2]
MKKYKDLPELAAELQKLMNSNRDVVVPKERLRVISDSDNKIIKMEIADTDEKKNAYPLNEYAHSQVSEKTEIPKTYYDRMRERGKVTLLANNINTWLPEKDARLIRIQSGQIRAILSNKYRIVDHVPVLNVAFREIKRKIEEEKQRIEPIDMNLTDIRMYLKFINHSLSDEIFDVTEVSEGKKGDPVNAGIMISNSEVGSGGFSVTPFINIIRCTNGLLQETKLRIIHIGKELELGEIQWSRRTMELEDELLKAKMVDFIDQCFTEKVFRKWVDQINEKAGVVIERPVDAVKNIIKRFGMAEKVEDDLLNFFAKENNTAWGLSNALTSYAKTVSDYDKQVELERAGAEVLELPEKQLVALSEAVE